MTSLHESDRHLTGSQRHKPKTNHRRPPRGNVRDDADQTKIAFTENRGVFGK